MVHVQLVMVLEIIIPKREGREDMENVKQIYGVMKKRFLFLMMLFLSLMVFGNFVFAQEEASTDDDTFVLEEIRVTGSRIRTSGMETPTPVTVMTVEEINFASPTTMIEGLAELPMFYGSNTTQNTGGFFETSGAGTLNLRGLQGKRTLTLLDGRRVVMSTIFGGPDINMFPELLLRSFETVTGGASAAYGTDAVAGVTNFILDTDYEGVKGHVQYGQTERGMNDNYEIELAGGYQFKDGTRLLLSYEKGEQDPIYGNQLDDFDWYSGTALVPNPADNAGDSPDNPYYIEAPNVYSRTSNIYGIFYTPGAYASAKPIFTFDDAGNVVPWVDSAGPCSGGFANQMCSNPDGTGSASDSAPWDNTTITPESGRENFFGYIERYFGKKLKVYAQGLYGKTHFTNRNYGGVFARDWGGLTIYRENPFLPTTIQDYMDENSMSSIKFGRNGGPLDIGYDPYTEQKTKTLSLTGGFDYNVYGGFFDGWQVKGYVQHGKTDVKAIQRGGVRLDRIYLAMDVVTDPLTGQPACNVAVTTRGTENEMYQDCVPLNLFGAGNASAEAVDWVTGYEPGVQMNVEGFLSATESIPLSYMSSANKLRDIEIEQNVFEVTVDGDLYEGWGAGPISMALGYHWREAEFTQLVLVGPGGNENVDPTYLPVMATNPALGIRGVAGGNKASGNIVDIQFSNVPFARGDQSVQEVFSELLIPVIADLPYVKQLLINGAARWADYSGAGETWSYKAGFDYAPITDLRFRGTYSQDVRAATMGEKYDRTGGIASVTDWLAEDYTEESVSYNITRFSNGSPDIQPEKAITKTFGLVYMPRWLKGLSFSTDWYSIDIKDNISKLSSGEVTEGCYVDGIQSFCDMITRGGDPVTDGNGEILDDNGNPIPAVTLVGEPYINRDSVKAVGIDFEIGYRRAVDWFGGGENIGVRFLGSYVKENSSTTDGVSVETADITYPRYTATLSLNYQRGGFGIWVQNRYRGETLKNRNYNWNGDSERWDVPDNIREAEILTDLNLNYRFDLDRTNLNFFFNVSNVLDKDPEPSYAVASSWFGTGPGIGHVGDLRGRRFVFGLSFEFK